MSNFILNGIKQYVIENINPSKLSSNPIEGLREKENILKMFNPCLLRDIIKDYDQLEDLVANTMGDKFTDVVLKRITEDDLEVILPTLDVSEIHPYYDSSSSSSSSLGIESVTSGLDSICPVALYGGNMKLSRFDKWEWSIQRSPPNSTVSINENSLLNNDDQIDKLYSMIFSDPGQYILSLKVTEKYLGLFVIANVLVGVV